MTIKVPPGNDAKGRNGYFRMSEIVATKLLPESEQRYHIDIYSSRRTSSTGPISLQLNLAGVEALVEALASFTKGWKL